MNPGFTGERDRLLSRYWMKDSTSANHGLVVILAVSLSAGATACAPDSDDVPARRTPGGTPLEIDAEARLTVGTVEGEPAEQFHRVVTPFLLPDGRLVVPVAGASEIRVFGPDGRHVSRLGGPGEGPGEFGSLNAAWPRGDTIEAFDGDLRRITRFFPDGGTGVVELGGARPAHMAVPGTLPEGWVLSGVAGGGFGRRDEMVVDRFALDGTHRNEIARVEGMARVRTAVSTGPDPLSPKPVFSVHGGEVYVAETLTPTIRVLDPAGALEREITWAHEPSVSPEAAFARVVDEAVARAGPDEAAETRRRLEAFPIRDAVSAFWHFIVDDEGFVWVRPFEPAEHSLVLGGLRRAGPGGNWAIFSPGGKRVASVDAPEHLELRAVTSDAVVGVRRNDLGVEFVEVHSLVRRR